MPGLRRPMKYRSRMGLLATLVIVATVAGISIPLSASAATYTPVSGTGSIWAQNALDQWRKDLAANEGMTVNYSGTGSSAGRRDFQNGTVDFAVSEIPFQAHPEDGSAPETPSTGFTYIPSTAGATSILYNLTIGGTRVTDLRLSGTTLTKIFTGVITNWSDPDIRAENPQLAMPNRTITPVVRSDGSGSTNQFTRWMATEHSGLWSDFCIRTNRPTPCGPTSQYPIFGNAKAQSGSLGVAGYVSQSYGDGSLTYVENSYAVKSGFPVAKILNHAGYYTAPTATSVSIALLGAQFNTDAFSPDYRTQILDQVYANTDPRAYPLSSYAYLIVPTEVAGIFSASKGASLAEFAHFALCEGQNKMASLGYAPLPINLVAEGLSQIARIPGAQGTATILSQCSNPTFAAGDTPQNNLLLRSTAAPAITDACEPEQCLSGTDPITPTTTGVGLRAQAIAAVDGTLSLITDSNSPVIFASPQLIFGLSVSRGILPNITVSDGRIISRPGWDLTVGVSDFVNDADASVTIPNTQVGLAVHLVNSTSSGIQLAALQQGGSAHYPAPFASAPALNGTGDTVLGGEVTLVAPANRPAGNYSSVLTLTITSR